MANRSIHFGSFLLLLIRFSIVANIEDTEFELKNKDSNFEDVFKYAINACKIKERASDQDAENIFNRFLPETAVEKCFVACWLESFHVIKNRQFNREQYIKLSTYGQDFDGDKQKVLRQILQGCKFPENCRMERCDLAYRVMKCIYDGAKKLNLDPKEL